MERGIGAALLGGAFCMLSALSGCQSLPAIPEYRQPGTVWISNKAKMTIPPASAFVGHMDEVQRVEAEFRGKTFYFQAYARAGDGEVDLVAMSDLGVQLFSLAYSDRGLAFSGMSGFGSLKPEYILADFELVYWPYESLAPLVSSAGLRLVETESGGGIRKRSLMDGARKIFEIEYGPGAVQMDNLLRGYRYRISKE